MNKHITPLNINLNNLPSDMSPEDQAFIVTLMAKYANTNAKVDSADLEKALDLIGKYQIKINNNPRPILSRFRKIVPNEKSVARRKQPGTISKGKVKKLKAQAIKLANRQKHS